MRDFSLHALIRSDPEIAGRPVGLIAGKGREAVVVSVSMEASGAAPGIAPTLAMARCQGIVLRSRDAGAENEARRVLLAAAFTLSPRVEVTAPGLCTIDLRGADPIRTEAEMRRRIAELARAGLPARGGMGATPWLASQAARCADPVLVVTDPADFLALLPLSFAEPSPDHEEILRGWGIKTLGDLFRLSKADVGERLGAEGVALWERAAGETTRMLRLVEPPRTFLAEWDYEPPVESLEPLRFRLRRYAERIALELRAAGFVAGSLALTLRLEDETVHRREFRLPEPGADVDSWLRVLHAHLETVRTEARVIGVRLVARPARPPVRQDGLFDTGLRDPASFWENVARLGALVGGDRVGRPVAVDTHRPDAFVLERPVETIPACAAPPVHPPRGFALRRFRPPWPAKVAIAAERPAAIETGRLAGVVRDARGPWRLSGDWWKAEAWAFEVWHVEMSDGGVYQLTRTGEGWRVEGILD